MEKMKIPVLIAARNEEARIERTLKSLPDFTQPVVITNGCTDSTAEIADACGATVFESSVEGKVPALQLGIVRLGNKALKPFVTLDADTQPLFPKKWLPGMGRALYRHGRDDRRPAIIIGPLVFNRIGIASRVWRNSEHLKTQWQTRNSETEGYFSGANMLMRLCNDDVVDKVLMLPNIWPGEESAIRDIVLNNNGIVRKTMNPHAGAATSGERFPDIRTRFSMGRDEYIKTIQESYNSDAPAGAIPYTDYAHGNVQQIRAA